MARQRLLWSMAQHHDRPAHPSAASSNKFCFEWTKTTSQPLWMVLSTAGARRCFLAKPESQQTVLQASHKTCLPA